MKKIILASGSPRRKELLAQIGIQFEVKTSNADEIITESEPGKIVMELSDLKASAFAEEIDNEYVSKCLNKEETDQVSKRAGAQASDYVVIGADTIVYHNGKVLGKTADEEQAYRMIASLAGDTHQVYTGVTIINGTQRIHFHEKTDVSVYEMSDSEIRNFIATGESMDKAGAYGIQGAFAAFVKKIDGDYNNVVGLPVARLYHELRKADII